MFQFFSNPQTPIIIRNPTATLFLEKAVLLEEDKVTHMVNWKHTNNLFVEGKNRNIKFLMR